MPQMGFDMQEGTLVRWLKQEGEEIKKGETIAEIETDKAVIEMEAYISGVVLKTIVSEGSTVPVGQAIAFIGVAGEVIHEGKSAVKSEGQKPAVFQPKETEQSATPALSQIKASPLARKLAEENGITLEQVTGTGPNGRITKNDILAYATRVPAALHSEETSTLLAGATGGEIVPLSRMRQAIARRTAQSKREVPHFYITADVDMTLAMILRKQLNETLNGETKVTVNDLIVKACALTLAKFPVFNGSFEDDHMRMNVGINVGIAVAVEQGLLVVSLGECRDRSVVDISKTAKEVVERAQSGVMREEDYTGSTFSISNMGMFDVDSFSAIIYPPQSAVLAVGTIRKQPVVREDQITIAQVMKATMSTDHRVADGAQAAQFLVEIKRVLENPVAMLV